MKKIDWEEVLFYFNIIWFYPFLLFFIIFSSFKELVYYLVQYVKKRRRLNTFKKYLICWDFVPGPGYNPNKYYKNEES